MLTTIKTSASTVLSSVEKVERFKRQPDPRSPRVGNNSTSTNRRTGGSRAEYDRMMEQIMDDDNDDDDESDDEFETEKLEKMIEKLARIAHRVMEDTDTSLALNIQQSLLDNETGTWLTQNFTSRNHEEVSQRRPTLPKNEIFGMGDSLITPNGNVHSELEPIAEDSIVNVHLLSVPKPLQIDLATLHSFSFNVLSFTNLYDVHEIVCHMLLPLANLFHVDIHVLRNFLICLSRGYVETNPYHNYYHGVDVFHTSYLLLSKTRFFDFNNPNECIFTPLEAFSLLIAAISHDVGHIGVNNNYLIKSKHGLALKYNDRSPLENHHCSLLFQILHGHITPANNRRSVNMTPIIPPPVGSTTVAAGLTSPNTILQSTPKLLFPSSQANTTTVTPNATAQSPAAAEARNGYSISNSIAVFDEHAGITTVSNANSTDSNTPSGVTLASSNAITAAAIAAANAAALQTSCNVLGGLTPDEWKEARKIILNVILSTDMQNHADQITKTQMFYDLHKEELSSFYLNENNYLPCVAEEKNRFFLMEIIIHSSDISNPFKPFNICSSWADLVVKEFCLQGDREKREGMEVSPGMDRDLMNIHNMQMGFIEFVVAPFLVAFINVFPTVYEIGENIVSNHSKWGEKRKIELQGMIQNVQDTLDSSNTSSQFNGQMGGPGGSGGEHDSQESSTADRPHQILQSVASSVSMVSQLSVANVQVTPSGGTAPLLTTTSLTPIPITVTPTPTTNTPPLTTEMAFQQIQQHQDEIRRIQDRIIKMNEKFAFLTDYRKQFSMSSKNSVDSFVSVEKPIKAMKPRSKSIFSSFVSTTAAATGSAGGSAITSVNNSPSGMDRKNGAGAVKRFSVFQARQPGTGLTSNPSSGITYRSLQTDQGTGSPSSPGNK